MHFQFLCETMKGIRPLPLPFTPGSYPAVLIEGLPGQGHTPLLSAFLRELIPNQLWVPGSPFLDRRTGNNRVRKIHPRDFQGTEEDLKSSWCLMVSLALQS